MEKIISFFTVVIIFALTSVNIANAHKDDDDDHKKSGKKTVVSILDGGLFTGFLARGNSAWGKNGGAGGGTTGDTTDGTTGDTTGDTTGGTTGGTTGDTTGGTTGGVGHFTGIWQVLAEPNIMISFTTDNQDIIGFIMNISTMRSGFIIGTYSGDSAHFTLLNSSRHFDATMTQSPGNRAQITINICILGENVSCAPNGAVVDILKIF